MQKNAYTVIEIRPKSTLSTYLNHGLLDVILTNYFENALIEECFETFPRRTPM